MIEGASPYKVFGRKKRSKCFKPKPRTVRYGSRKENESEWRTSAESTGEPRGRKSTGS